MKYRQRLEKAARGTNSSEDLLREVKALLALGVDRNEILDVFEVIRTALQKDNMEEAEDIVLEVMDLLVGWCSPHAEL